ncbi:TetR family transcriptional regulator [Corynebacterium sp. S7]
MKALSSEQLLIVADEFCAHARVAVRDFSALAAIAAIPGASFHGIAVHASVEAAARSLEAAIRKLHPLTSRNDEFATATGEIYRRWANDSYLQELGTEKFLAR